jgi:hypothetical protein
VIWVSEKQKYFCKKGWTGQISLIRLDKFRFTRNRRSADVANGKRVSIGSMHGTQLRFTQPGWRSRLDKYMDRAIAELANNVPRLRGKSFWPTAAIGPSRTRVRGQRCGDRFLPRVVSELAGRPATD